MKELNDFGVQISGGAGDENVQSDWDQTDDTADDFIKNKPTIVPLPKPHFSSIDPIILDRNVTSNLTLSGSYFTEDTVISIGSQTVNSTTFVSDNEITINVTTSAVGGTFDIILNNGNETTITDGFEVIAEVAWFDLRSGGDTFTHGNGAGNDVRYASGMSMNRLTSGIVFSGEGPWVSWAKFENLQFTRGSNSTVEWIFNGIDGIFMIGIGSDATNEGSSAQYAEGEAVGYFNSATSFWGLYGNTGTVGNVATQSNAATFTANSTLKVKFENDGEAGEQFTLYSIPSADPSDWDDETTVIATFAVGGGITPNEANIMPFIMPRDGGTQRFIAVRVS